MKILAASTKIRQAVLAVVTGHITLGFLFAPSYYSDLGNSDLFVLAAIYLSPWIALFSLGKDAIRTSLLALAAFASLVGAAESPVLWPFVAIYPGLAAVVVRSRRKRLPEMPFDD